MDAEVEVEVEVDITKEEGGLLNKAAVEPP